MTTTNLLTNGFQSDKLVADPVDADVGPGQYSMAKILGIWASVTAPMGVLAFVVAPAVTPHTSLHPGLVHWILMVVGMAWQFVVAVLILRRELGGLAWPAVKARIRLNGPRDPPPGRARRVLWLGVLPRNAANAAAGGH